MHKDSQNRLENIAKQLATLPAATAPEELHRRLEIEKLLREELSLNRPFYRRLGFWGFLLPGAVAAVTLGTQLYTDYYENMARLAELERQEASDFKEEARQASDTAQASLDEATRKNVQLQDQLSSVRVRAAELAGKDSALAVKEADLAMREKQYDAKLEEVVLYESLKRVLTGTASYPYSYPWDKECGGFLSRLSSLTSDQLTGLMDRANQEHDLSLFRKGVFLFCVYAGAKSEVAREQLFNLAREASTSATTNSERRGLFSFVFAPALEPMLSQTVNVRRPDWLTEDIVPLLTVISTSLEAADCQNADRAAAILSAFEASAATRLRNAVRSFEETRPEDYQKILSVARCTARAIPGDGERRELYGDAFEALSVLDPLLLFVISSDRLLTGAASQYDGSANSDRVTWVASIVTRLRQSEGAEHLDIPAGFGGPSWSDWRNKHRELVRAGEQGTIEQWISARNAHLTK